MRVGAQTGMGYPFRRFLAAVGENNPRFRAVSRKEALSLRITGTMSNSLISDLLIVMITKS